MSDLRGRQLYFASVDEHGVVTDLVADEYGFMSVYLVVMDSGQIAALHEDKLIAAGVLRRTLH